MRSFIGLRYLLCSRNHHSEAFSHDLTAATALSCVGYRIPLGDVVDLTPRIGATLGWAAASATTCSWLRAPRKGAAPETPMAKASKTAISVLCSSGLDSAAISDGQYFRSPAATTRWRHADQPQQVARADAPVDPTHYSRRSQT